MIDLVRFHCLRCHHTWVPRTNALPKRCPGCFTPLWNREYVRVERLTDDVMARLEGCPFRMCQQRYERLNGISTVDLEAPRTRERTGSLRTTKRMIKITKDNFPDIFKRIKHD